MTYDQCDKNGANVNNEPINSEVVQAKNMDDAVQKIYQKYAQNEFNNVHISVKSVRACK